MNKFEYNPSSKKESAIYCQEVDDIAFQAAELLEFQEVVKKANSKFEAVRDVRVLLQKHFPEIPDLPKPAPPQENGIRFKNPLGGVASNEHKIARNIVDLLWNKK